MSFSAINNLNTPSSKLQINFGVLQIDTENSATGTKGIVKLFSYRKDNFSLSIPIKALTGLVRNNYD